MNWLAPVKALETCSGARSREGQGPRKLGACPSFVGGSLRAQQMRSIWRRDNPHPAFGHPLPGGEGPTRCVAATHCASGATWPRSSRPPPRWVRARTKSDARNGLPMSYTQAGEIDPPDPPFARGGVRGLLRPRTASPPCEGGVGGGLRTGSRMCMTCVQAAPGRRASIPYAAFLPSWSSALSVRTVSACFGSAARLWYSWGSVS